MVENPYAKSHGEFDVHIMSGNGRQRVMVVPELSLAVTMFAGHYDETSAEIVWMPTGCWWSASSTR